MWREGNPPTLLMAMEIGAATMENSMEVPKKLEIGLPYDPQSHSGLYPGKTIIKKGVHAPQNSQQHYLQLSRHGNKLSINQQKNG